MPKSLNKSHLIGNLTADPELRYTPQGTAVISFSVATNRSWKDSQGQAKEEVTFHRIIAWSKLAEICSQILFKGRKVYISGRISNRSWDDKDGNKHYMTEIIAEDMIALDSKKQETTVDGNTPIKELTPPEPVKLEPIVKGGGKNE